MITLIDNILYEKFVTIYDNPIAPDCFFTSILIFLVGLLKFCYNSNLWNFSVICLGITSILHHSRLDVWYIKDYYRLLDNIAVISISFIGFYCLNHKKLWIFISLYCAFIFYCIMIDAIEFEYIPLIHSTTHMWLIIITLIDDLIPSVKS